MTDEEILELIRQAEDYTSQIYYHDESMQGVINYIEETGTIIIEEEPIGKKATMTYNYELVEGGYALKSTTLVITDL